MNYAVSRLEEERETTAYRVYITDCLYSSGRTNIKERWWDWIHKKPQPKDTRTEEEIILDIIKRSRA